MCIELPLINNNLNSLSEIDETEKKHLAAVQKAIDKQGSLTHKTVHGAIVGLARSGKDSLMKRFLGDMPTNESPSTGLAEKVVHVKVVKSSTTSVSVKKSNADPEELEWTKLIHYDDEAVQMMTQLTAEQNIRAGTPHVRMSNKKESNMKLKSSDKITEQTKQQESQSDQVHSEGEVSRASVGNSAQLECSNSYNEPKLHSETTTHKPPMEIFKEALKNKGLWGLQQHLENHCSLYLSNTGGQMEFQELLPLVVSGPSLIFVTFRLDRDLNQQYEIEYEIIVQANGFSKPKIFKYTSSATPLETILQTLATYDTTCTFDYSQQQREIVALTYKVFIIGTHRDILERSMDCDEKVASKISKIDKEIYEAVQDATYFRNIEFATRNRLIFTVNNFSESDSDFHLIRSSAQQVIDRGDFRISTPSHWLIYSLVLRQLKSRIESYENCFRIARDCGITSDEEHREALHFIHTKMGVIRYFQQDDLDQIVFLDPQVLFDKVTELITNTFTFKKAGRHIENDFKKGIFSFSDLEKLLCSDPLLTPSKFAKLLEHLRIAAPFNQDGCLKYFFPCAIAHADESDKPSSQSNLYPIPPLVVSFECGYRPMGLAGALITYLMANERQSEQFKWNLSTETLFRNQVSFIIEPSYDTVILKLFPSHLEITFTPDPNDHDRNHSPIENVCHEVWRTIQVGISKVNSDINYIRNTEPSFTFYCQAQDCKVAKPHPAKFSPAAGKLFCPKCNKTCTLPNGYKTWILHEHTKEGCTFCNPNVAGKNTDTRCRVSHFAHLLSQLEDHAVKWKEIGTFLNFRPGELNNIEVAPKNRTGAPKSYLSAMLEEWLEWAPGDARRSKDYATLNSLKRAVSKAGLGVTAERLTLQPEHIVRGSTQ